MGDTIDITYDLKRLESRIDSLDIEENLSWEISLNLYKINSSLGNYENGKKYLEIAYNKVTDLLNRMNTEADREQLFKNIKDCQYIVEEWEKSEL
ncbi:MAG: hypothetical protein U9N72_07440 [Bacteroidota bacterium]|nr:hypothetical protein [Bacteroidota bacterium]